jgi:hypothetical protein
MTTQTHEAPPREHNHKIHTPKREEAQTPKHEKRSELVSFSEAESAPKPLVAFDAPPVAAALPLTW